jgi:hypothetical protein
MSVNRKLLEKKILHTLLIVASAQVLEISYTFDRSSLKGLVNGVQNTQPQNTYCCSLDIYTLISHWVVLYASIQNKKKSEWTYACHKYLSCAVVRKESKYIYVGAFIRGLRIYRRSWRVANSQEKIKKLSVFCIIYSAKENWNTLRSCVQILSYISFLYYATNLHTVVPSSTGALRVRVI